MKVTLENCYKSLYTIADLERAKSIIKYEKTDESTAEEWAVYAIHEALKDSGDWMIRVLEAKATTNRNCRVWDAYGLDSGDMDVWIEAIAKTGKGFIEIGAYLSDIWQTGSEYHYKDKMFIDHYTK